jgi:hypothetical protein
MRSRRGIPLVVLPIVLLVVGLVSACTPRVVEPAAPAAEALEPSVRASTEPAPPPPAFVAVAEDDPAAAYAPYFAQSIGRDLVVGNTASIIERLLGTDDVLVVSSRGNAPVVSRADLGDGVRVGRLLVGDADAWAVRVAADADRILLTSDPESVEAGPGEAIVRLPDDVRAPGPINDLLRETEADIRVHDDEADLGWMVEVVRTAPELPGGGHLVFSGKRLVAVYGHPTTPSLGVLGEQGIEATIERVQGLAEQYADDDLVAVPAFDMITTIAAAEAGDDGDYSRETPIDTMRPWVDAAGESGVYVVLDLQPGRTDFLTQAKMYEELLLEPHVGLALDPEWRLGPNQVHLRQIGSVNATEVNATADWLAELVRTNELPQKLFMVHQFKLSMIADRDLLDTSHPELAHTIQMDGQGPIGTKDETYAALTRGFEDRVFWGWKNFYDEDLPTPSPEHTMTRTPEPVFVSYQ